MNWGILSFIKFISYLCGENDIFFSLGGLKFCAPLGLTLDMLLDDLIDRNVEHVVLDSEVSASGVNTKSLLMVDQNNLWLELVDQFFLCRHEGCFCVEFHVINSSDMVLVGITDHTRYNLVIFCVFFQCSNLFFSTITIIVEFTPSCLDFKLIFILSLSSCKIENKVRKAEIL